jgi:hypothetical protein
MGDIYQVFIISCVWDVTILLCFCGAIDGSTLITLAILCINGANKVTQHHLRGYGLSDLLHCVLQPLDVNFISGLHSCGIQHPCSWLIVELLSLIWVKNYKWSHWKPLLWPTVFCWAVMFNGQAFSLVILCWLCSWRNIHGGHKWHNILK